MEKRKAHSDFSHLVIWPSLHVIMTMAHYINYEHTFTFLSRYQKKEKIYTQYMVADMRDQSKKQALEET